MVYLPMNYGAKIISFKCVYDYFNWSNTSWILEHPEITTTFQIKILDEFIYNFKCLNNTLIRKYLSNNEIISLNHGLSVVKIENDRVKIKRLGE